jgi:hypothetical protein
MGNVSQKDHQIAGQLRCVTPFFSHPFISLYGSSLFIYFYLSFCEKEKNNV